MVTVRQLDFAVREGPRRRLVLDGVSCDFPPSRLTVVTGPSGSGKTTLLALIGCLLTPTGGSITMRGRELTTLGAHERDEVRRAHVGFIFQHHRLLSRLNVFDNVAMALRLLNVEGSELRVRVRAALEDLQLGAHASSNLRVLSGGERQRVAIARALVKRPAVILADEPTASLDGRTAGDLVATLQALAHSSHSTVIVVTHDQRLLQFADGVVAMEDGIVTHVEDRS